MAQEKCCQQGLDQELGRTRYLETTKGRGETVERTRMQQRHKGLRPETPATRQNENKGPRQQMAPVYEEGEDNLEKEEK
jgi:hypothetical protein